MLIEFTTCGLNGMSGDEKAMRTYCLIPALCLFMELVFNEKLYLYLLCVVDLQARLTPDFKGLVLWSNSSGIQRSPYDKNAWKC